MADQLHFWCLVSNPRRWPVFRFLSSDRTIDAWRISPNLVQVPNQVANGQYAVLRVGTGGGNNHPPGIYAICRLLSDALSSDSPEILSLCEDVPPLYEYGRAFDGLYQVVIVELLARFPESAVTINRLAQESATRGANIGAGLINGRETSIFEISKGDFYFYC